VILYAVARGAPDLDERLADYEDEIDEASAAIEAAPGPPGIEPFRSDVLEALALQREFFGDAVALRRDGADMEAVYAIPTGRRASRLLKRAWGRMDRRYGSLWSRETRESVYHHLCALDLF